MNLSNANLTGAKLDGANFRKAKLVRVNMTSASLRGTDLRNADLTEATLTGADMTGAQASGIEFFRCEMAGVNSGEGESAKREFPSCEYSRSEIYWCGYGRHHLARDRFGRRGFKRRGFEHHADAEGFTWPRSRSARYKRIPTMRIWGTVLLVLGILFLIMFALAELGGAHLGFIPFFVSGFLILMGWNLRKSGVKEFCNRIPLPNILVRSRHPH